ncbi:MAG: hypothetical protein ACRDPW_03330 [Mycobacteriales bacterium]
MPSGVPSAVLFALLIGAALLALLPALISGSSEEPDDKGERELAESGMRVLDRGKKPVAVSEDLPASAAVVSDTGATDLSQQRRALEFVEKLSRTSTLDATVQREVVAWLATPVKQRYAPTVGITQVLAAADKEPYRSGEAWLVRGANRQRPRLVAVPPPARHAVTPPGSARPEFLQPPQRRRAA